ncbi:MAG: argininosuccinate lyase, partial [Nitrospirae bacterium]
ISFDHRLWPYDIRGSIAHARMLARQGIIKREEAKKIIDALKGIAKDIEEGRFQWKRELEDVHMNIEAELINRIGPVGGKLHTARSRNDQVALDLRLYLKDEISSILKLIRKLQRVFLRLATKYKTVPMPGYTHLQRAQPVTIAQHMLAYVEMLERDRERFQDCLKRTDSLPLGACALSGTTLPIDRRYVAKLLGFSRISLNSMDAVSDRDFAIEFIFCCSVLMMHLSRLSEELILWATEEFGFVELPDAFCTGSSIMPQKKNPDVAELLRGKSGRLYGDLISLLTLMKALPLTYNRDMQEDKPPVFNAADTLKASLGVLIEMLPRVRFKTPRIAEAATGGYSLATDIAEYLVRKGVPFRKAHEITGQVVSYAIQLNKGLHELDIKDFKRFSDAFEEDVLGLFELKKALSRRASLGSTSFEEVKGQIELWKERLKG